MKVSAVIVAAGRGIRAGAALPKQYLRLADEPILRRTLRVFDAHAGVRDLQTVIEPLDLEHYGAAAAGLPKCLPPAHGGATRQQSVLAGLEAVAARNPDIVLVHDAARPFVSASLIDRAISAVATADAAVPALPLADTIKHVDVSGRVIETLPRDLLRAVQTPQAFRFGGLLSAHRKAAAAGHADFPDDAALAEWAGIEVATFAGETNNMKLTTPDDFLLAAALDNAPLGDVRTGTGFDVHAFGPGDHVKLGGVRIAHTQGLVGHSDADVLLHALTDAVLGAISEADIGQHFPPSDERWRGASSAQFLAHAVALVRRRGGRIAQLDATLLCEAPRIGAHRHAIRARIAEIAAIDPDRVSVKATTTERLGFIGRGEGIAAMATATVRLPWSAP